MNPFSFRNPRLDFHQVYAAPPVVFDTLGSLPFPPVKSRVVRIDNDFFELWSPNTTQKQYYPGRGEIPSARQRLNPGYPDGRLGPRDWTLHPQHFSRDYPWLGFCRSPLVGVDPQQWRYLPAELVPLTHVWIFNGRSGMGQIHATYGSRLRERTRELWSAVDQYSPPADLQRDPEFQLAFQRRPRYPSLQDMFQLQAQTFWHWEEFMDVVTAVQRGLREMEAWLTMASHWASRFETATNPSPVDNARIGVWLNGASKVEAYWLLRICVIPVYIIHRFVEDVDFPKSPQSLARDRRPNKYLKDFLHGTASQRLNSSRHNPYLEAYLRHSSLRPPLPFHRTQLPISSPSTSLAGHAASSSWAFRVRERAISDTEPHRLGDGTGSQNPEAIANPEASASLPSAGLGSSGRKRGELQTDGVESYWIPPAVIYGPRRRRPEGKTRGGKRKKGGSPWDRFSEGTELVSPDETVMVFASGGADEDYDSDTDDTPSSCRTYWDRRLGRKLIFDKPLPPNKQAHYDQSVFGFPLPLKSYYVYNGSRLEPRPASSWAYLQPHPNEADVGREAPIEECHPPQVAIASLEARNIDEKMLEAELTPVESGPVYSITSANQALPEPPSPISPLIIIDGDHAGDALSYGEEGAIVSLQSKPTVVRVLADEVGLCNCSGSTSIIVTFN